MIARQSSRSILACCHHPGSPEGCGKLAGDNIPGNCPNNPRALKGRWKEPVSRFGSHLLCPVAPNFHVLDSAASLYLGDRSRFPKAIQGYLTLSEPIQGFFEKVFFLFAPKYFVAQPLPLHPMTPKPKRKSTIARPKSTVDLGFEPLIRVENDLQTPFLLGYRHSFRPITTLEWRACKPKTGRSRPKTESCPHCSLNEKAGARRQNKINYPPLIYG